MGDFLEKNKMGFGLAALVGIASIVLTNGFGLLPLALAAGAFFLPALFSGENNFFSGLFGGNQEKKKPGGADTPQPQVAPGHGQEHSHDVDEPSTSSASPAPSRTNTVPTGNSIPLRIMDDKGNLLIKDTLVEPAFALSDDNNNSTHAVFGKLSADRKTFDVHAISSIENGEVQDIGWNPGTPIRLPVQSGQINLANKEFLAAQQEVTDYVTPKEMIVTQDKDTGMLATVIGQTELEGRKLNVVMLGRQTTENQAQFTNFVLQDDIGQKLLASNGQIISSPIEGFPEIRYDNNKFVLYTGAAETMSAQAVQAMADIRERDLQVASQVELVNQQGQPLNAAADGSQFIVLDVAPRSAEQMRQIAGDLMPNSQSYPEMLALFDNENASMQVALRGTVQADGAFHISERHMLVSTPENNPVYMSTVNAAPTQGQLNMLPDKFGQPRDSIRLENLQTTLREIALDQNPQMQNVDVRIQSAMPSKILAFEQRMREHHEQEAAQQNVAQPDVSDEMKRSLEQFKDGSYAPESPVGISDAVTVPQVPTDPEKAKGMNKPG